VKRAKTLWHATTPKKLARYHASGRILLPVRGFDSLDAAKEWARKVGRSIVLRFEGRDVHKLPDHHVSGYGLAWWEDADVETWTIEWTKGEAP
jgi:hypothetical protein